MVEREKTTDYYCFRTSLVKKWKGKQFRLAHFLVALVLVVGGLLMASYAYNQYSQSNVATQLIGYSLVYQNSVTFSMGMPSVPGTDDIVPVAQKGWYNDTHTEAGTIDIIGTALPSEFPLCINNTWLANYWVAVNVTGGYTPYDSFVIVWQKGEVKGCIKITWTLMNPNASCCEPKTWNATFYVCEPICLDSDQYPSVPAPWEIDTQGNQYIPGKDVDLRIITKWLGCPLPEQAFVIISVQNN